MADENAEALDAAIKAAITELDRQSKTSMGILYGDGTPESFGIDGCVDLPALVRAIVEAWEATPHLPTRVGK